MVKAEAETLMAAEADSVCGAPYRQTSAERVNHRNGTWERRWDSRVGTMERGIPRLRKGSYYPDWLLEPRRQAERAVMQGVTECCVRGVSTRWVDGLVRTLGPSDPSWMRHGRGHWLLPGARLCRTNKGVLAGRVIVRAARRHPRSRGGRPGRPGRR